MDKKDKKEKKIDFKDQKTKAYIFFGFYFVFFLVLIIMIRSAPVKENDTNTGENNTTTVTPTPSNNATEEQEANDNYQFIYTIEKDSNSFAYMGKKFGNKEQFTYVHGSTDTYYRVQDSFFKKEGDNYEVATSPYEYEEFLSLTKLSELIRYKVASNETENEATYPIAVSDWLDIYYENAYYDGFVVDEFADDIVVVTRTSDKITKAVLNLDNLMSYFVLAEDNTYPKHLKITLEFYDYDKVEDFTM